MTATIPRYAFDRTGAIYGPVDAGADTFVRHEDLEAAERAVGTLQTALRQLILDWRARAGEWKQVWPATPSEEHDLFPSGVYRRCADELEALLPALEPTP